MSTRWRFTVRPSRIFEAKRNRGIAFFLMMSRVAVPQDEWNDEGREFGLVADGDLIESTDLTDIFR
ncbi:hypothetical protein V5E97_24145 [Singulisphaera sp. Ch08]|uniref:Uncharacterized protein n=1 Tax=Singulisphaera sp. Ch08 TaxID=3120278 RepID=A0AAU7C8F1_9BACT